MAIDTGGFFTKNTNDFSLAYARARTDQSCHYTLGFYEDDPKVERGHEIRVTVKRPGLHISYPAGYAFQSDESKKKSLLRAAFVAPTMFQQGVVRAHLFPLGPKSKKSWACLLAIDFPLTRGAETAGPVERQFGLVVRRGPTVVHGTTRRVKVDLKNAGSTNRHVSFIEPLELEPGPYSVTVALGDVDSAKPYTAHVTIVVPPIPKGDVFLVEPVLGKRADRDVVIRAGGGPRQQSYDEAARGDRIGSRNSFMPVLVQRVEPFDQLLALTNACLVKGGRGEHDAVVQRRLDFEDGRSAGTLPAGQIGFNGKNKIDCQSLIDILPTSSLPSGDYVFTASLEEGEEPASQPHATRFSVAERPEPKGPAPANTERKDSDDSSKHGPPAEGKSPLPRRFN